MGDISRKGDIQVNIVDSDTQYKASIDASGRQLVSTTPVTPPDTTPITKSYFGTVAGDEYVYYTITNGKTIYIQTLSGACEQDSVAGMRMVLYYDEDGDMSSPEVLGVIFVNGNTFQISLDRNFTGDGTKRIVLRLTHLTGGDLESFSEWKGYEV